MAHSLAMDALTRGCTDRRRRYRDAALQFAQGVAASDVAAGAPVWFPIYPFDPGLRVLNADLQVIIGLQQVAKLDGAADYADLAKRAAATAEDRMPRYDTGAWSRYSEQREAPLEYHDLQTAQLGELGKALKDPVLGDYGQAFADYRTEAPAFDVVPGGTKRIYPVPRDGFRDTFAVKFTVTKLSTVVATWRRNGKKVRDIKLGLLSGGGHSLAWSPGKSAAGRYTIGFTAKDLAGNRGSVTDPREYEIARDRTPPTIVSVKYAGHKLTWKLKDSETPWVDVMIKNREEDEGAPQAQAVDQREAVEGALDGHLPRLVGQPRSLAAHRRHRRPLTRLRRRTRGGRCARGRAARPGAPSPPRRRPGRRRG